MAAMAAWRGRWPTKAAMAPQRQLLHVDDRLRTRPRCSQSQSLSRQLLQILKPPAAVVARRRPPHENVRPVVGAGPLAAAAAGLAFVLGAAQKPTPSSCSSCPRAHVAGVPGPHPSLSQGGVAPATRLHAASDLIGASLPSEGRRPDPGDGEGRLVREELMLEHDEGSLEVIVWRNREAPAAPTVFVNCACYATLLDALEVAEGQMYADRGYAYIIVRHIGSREDIADAVFKRWKADARAVLDYLGSQPWCNGNVGVHGFSLLGNTAYAALSVSTELEASGVDAPRIRAVVPLVSFSRIQPTIYLWGNGIAAELVLRFLWLVELGLRPGALPFPLLIWGLFCFFGLSEWPLLNSAAQAQPFRRAGMIMWSRENILFKRGAGEPAAIEEFWKDRDVQCDIAKLEKRCPPIHVVTGWYDIFLLQGLDDFMEAQGCKGSAPRLTVYAGGHFGVARQRAADARKLTAAWYDQHLARTSTPDSSKPRVNLEVLNGRDAEEWVECERWPPAESVATSFYLHVDEDASDSGSRVGSLEPAATSSDTLSGRGKSAEASADGSSRSSNDGAMLQYVYDPRDPTPYAGGSWLNLQKDGVADQRAIEKRDDVLVFTSAPLTTDLLVAGEVEAVLFMQASVVECDVVARLCAVRSSLLDADPQGEEAAEESTTDDGGMSGVLERLWPFGAGSSNGLARSENICEGVTRVRFDGNITSGEAKEVRIRVGPTACRFVAGDRIRLHVCSAAHPRFLRHPLHEDSDDSHGDGKTDWLSYSGSLGKPATLRLFADAAHSSQLSLPCR